MKRIFGILIASAALVSSAQAQEFPPATAKAGECYAKVLIPASYSTAAEQVMTSAGSTTFKKTPAVYKDVQKRVLVEEESFTLVPVPPTYETVTERVLIQPEQVVKSVVPVAFRTESKKILISPSRTEWKKGRGPFEKLDSATGEIMCRVEIPAVYKTITQQVVATPASTSEKIIPAKYATIERRKMKTEPSTQRKVVPAKYRTIVVKELVTPEGFESIKTPPRFATIDKRTLVSAEAVQWREILCETNTTPDLVLRLQKKLVSSGYSIGTTPNGNFGPATKAAVRKFQIANGLPTGGLTLSTVKKLGL